MHIGTISAGLVYCLAALSLELLYPEIIRASFVVCILFALHGTCSFVYHFIRTRNIFLAYYSKDVLSKPGFQLEEVPNDSVNPKEFSEKLAQLKKKQTATNEQRSKNTNTKPETRGLYGPEDKIWEVARESGVFFGGGRAVFLQLAHPYVASGVKQHSTAADDMQRRFYNTFHHMFRLSFGDLKVAEKSARQVRAIHDQVNGTLELTPPYPEDHKYTANHKDAIIWVWATLVDTSMFMFEILIRRMTLVEKEEYYLGQKEFVRFFGVDPSDVPADWTSFMEYSAKMWNSDILAVSETARKEDENLFRPKTLLARFTNKITRRITFALLPPRISEGFHVYLGTWDYCLLYSFFAVSRMIYSSLPGSLRYLTSYIEADKRIRGYSIYNETCSSFAAWVAGIILCNLIMEPKR